MIFDRMTLSRKAKELGFNRSEYEKVSPARNNHER